MRKVSMRHGPLETRIHELGCLESPLKTSFVEVIPFRSATILDTTEPLPTEPFEREWLLWSEVMFDFTLPDEAPI